MAKTPFYVFALGAAAGWVLTYFFSGGTFSGAQAVIATVAGMWLGGYLYRQTWAGYRCAVTGHGTTLVWWTCISSVVGGFVFLLCKQLSSGNETGIFQWIVSGGWTIVVFRGLILGAIAGLFEGIDSTIVKVDAQRAS